MPKQDAFAKNGKQSEIYFAFDFLIFAENCEVVLVW